MSFRATFEPVGLGSCKTWVAVDGGLYGGVAADEVVFGLSGRGEVVFVGWRALRERLVRRGLGKGLRVWRVIELVF